jgi:hypothetical protein
MASASILETDYFTDDPTYLLHMFWQPFRMNKELFTKIVHGVREFNPYFIAKILHQLG